MNLVGSRIEPSPWIGSAGKLRCLPIFHVAASNVEAIPVVATEIDATLPRGGTGRRGTRVGLSIRARLD
jgi:hypothetical protein